MGSELVEKWRARIIASEVSILTPSVQSGAQSLLRAQNDSKTWGAYKGMPLDLVSSAAAIEALESCEQSEFESTIENSRGLLKDYIRDRATSFGVAELAASLRILARAGRTDDLADSLVGKIGRARNGIGWGSPIPTILATADVLSALAPHRDLSASLIESSVQLLLSEQNEDGGWAVAIGGSQSAPLPSARAVCALVSAQPAQDSQDYDNAALYLRRLVEGGWALLIAETGDIQVAASVLRAVALVKSFPFDTLVQGVEAILDQRNSDGAWGERKGGNSNVEATSSCILALCATGANRLITSRFALSAVSDAADELQAARRDLEEVRSDIRTQVKRDTGGILKENERLKARVIELEKDKRILVSKVEESDRNLRELVASKSDQFDLRRGRASLLSGLGFWNSLFLILRKVSEDIAPITAMLLLMIVFLAVFPLLKGRLGLSLEVQKVAEYATLGAIVFIVVTLTYRLFTRSLPPEFLKRVGDLGASDRKLILRSLPAYMREWPAGTRESFLHQLSRLRGLSPDSREAASRSIAREFSNDRKQVEELGAVLSLFCNLPADEQTEVLYSLREVRGPVAMA